MRKAMIIGMIILLGMTIALAVNENKKPDCKEECIKNFKSSYETCKAAYDTGKGVCKEEFKSCMNDTKIIRGNCTSLSNRTEARECQKNASEEQKICVKEYGECSKSGREIFLGCLKEGRTGFEECKNTCKENTDELNTAQKLCEKLGGEFNQCASPCTSGDECIEQCTPKCEFKQCEKTEDCDKKSLCLDNKCFKR